MAKGHPKKRPRMFQVQLFIEVPDNLESPENWNWNNLINHDGTTDKNNTPVRFITAHHVHEGEA